MKLPVVRTCIDFRMLYFGVTFIENTVEFSNKKVIVILKKWLLGVVCYIYAYSYRTFVNGVWENGNNFITKCLL